MALIAEIGHDSCSKDGYSRDIMTAPISVSFRDMRIQLVMGVIRGQKIAHNKAKLCGMPLGIKF